jgi:site-specific recombinase XerD
MSIYPVVARIQGPLAALAEGYANDLTRLGYAPASIRLQMKVLADLSGWLLRGGVVAADLKSSVLRCFLRDRRAAGHARYASTRALQPILDYLQGLGVIARQIDDEDLGPVDAILDRFRRYLTVERGLAAVTSRAYLDLVRPFVQGRLSVDHGDLDFKNLSARDVVSFVVAHCPCQGRGAAKLTATALRSFLGFLHLDGAIESSLVSIGSGKQRADFLFGQEGYEPSIEARLTWTGRRDHALFGLAAQKGLRASELIGLCCADVHLGAGAHVSCHRKGRKQRITPLISATVATLRSWLVERAGQPAAPLFVTRSGAALSRDALEHRLAKYVQLAADACPTLAEKPVTMHVLRHSAAMRLLRAGIDTSVIALWLGHENVETTQLYLHADMGIKERALAKTAPAETRPGRFRPSDKLLAFLEAL